MPQTASSAVATRRFSKPATARRFSSKVLVFSMAVEIMHCLSSVALGNAGGFQGMRDVLPRFFAAQSWSRKNFRGIRKLQRVERAAYSLHGVEVGFAEHFRHHAFLFFADAVFASDGATGCEA